MHLSLLCHHRQRVLLRLGMRENRTETERPIRRSSPHRTLQIKRTRRGSCEPFTLKRQADEKQNGPSPSQRAYRDRKQWEEVAQQLAAADLGVQPELTGCPQGILGTSDIWGIWRRIS